MNQYYEDGTVALWWLGQMGLILKSGHTTLCIDYYASPDASRQTQPPVPADELTGIDAFLGTHDHLDHMDHEAWKIWAETNPDAKFIFPGKHRDSVLADGVAARNAVGLNDGESVMIGSFLIHAIAASHEFLDRDPGTGLYPYLQYIIESKSGVRIHHAGDTVRYEGMLPKIRAFGRTDIQLLPINGRDAERYSRNCIGNMTFQEAVDLAGELGLAMTSFAEATGGDKAGDAFARVPLATARDYSCEDVAAALALRRQQEPLLAEMGLAALMREVECPFIPLLADMEAAGVAVDAEVLRALGREFAERLTELLVERINIKPFKNFTIPRYKSFKTLMIY